MSCPPNHGQWRLEAGSLSVAQSNPYMAALKASKASISPVSRNWSIFVAVPTGVTQRRGYRGHDITFQRLVRQLMQQNACAKKSAQMSSDRETYSCQHLAIFQLPC